ncbi:MAG TPA: hypothetical protein PKE06_26480, partial [Flavilitoribacter sp.]|nr:hypothetical protein [Flavilitoribacter sp.]
MGSVFHPGQFFGTVEALKIQFSAEIFQKKTAACDEVIRRLPRLTVVKAGYLAGNRKETAGKNKDFCQNSGRPGYPLILSETGICEGAPFFKLP